VYEPAIRVTIEMIVASFEKINDKYYEEANLYSQLVESYKNCFIMVEENFQFLAFWLKPIKKTPQHLVQTLCMNYKKKLDALEKEMEFNPSGGSAKDAGPNKDLLKGKLFMLKSIYEIFTQ
jgi:hypothetical protein